MVEDFLTSQLQNRITANWVVWLRTFWFPHACVSESHFFTSFYIRVTTDDQIEAFQARSMCTDRPASGSCQVGMKTSHVPATWNKTVPEVQFVTYQISREHEAASTVYEHTYGGILLPSRKKIQATKRFRQRDHLDTKDAKIVQALRPCKVLHRKDLQSPSSSGTCKASGWKGYPHITQLTKKEVKWLPRRYLWS